ncbi:hypothetical protein U1Q18_040344 [Sarracenia purpurea var. burkii]
MEEVKNLVKFSLEKEAKKPEAEISLEGRGITSGRNPMEDNRSKICARRLDMNMGPNLMTSNRGPKSPLKCSVELTMIMGKEYPFRLRKGLLLTLCLHLLEKTLRKEKPNQTEKMKWRVLL